MPGILLKEVPALLHRRLKARAGRHRRSLSSEALLILEEALADRAGPPSLQEIDDLRVRGRRPLSQDLVDEGRHEGRP
jgi:plasmid stability protein